MQEGIFINKRGLLANCACGKLKKRGLLSLVAPSTLKKGHKQLFRILLCHFPDRLSDIFLE